MVINDLHDHKDAFQPKHYLQYTTNSASNTVLPDAINVHGSNY